MAEFQCPYCNHPPGFHSCREVFDELRVENKRLVAKVEKQDAEIERLHEKLKTKEAQRADEVGALVNKVAVLAAEKDASERALRVAMDELMGYRPKKEGL